MNHSKTILVTGAAGFIGASLVNRLLSDGNHVIGIDNINNYYEKKLKIARLSLISEKNLNSNSSWNFYKESIDDSVSLENIFKKHEPEIVINLAAQAGVRYSIKNPSAYIQSNLVGFGNILEMCRIYKTEHLLYASSSSVYGANKSLPYKENQSVSHPLSLYGATKKSNELMAHSYSHLYGIKSTGLRFFTVYGPWGRPDMAPMIFAKSILSKKPIEIFNNGNMKRDFTFIDDIVEAVFKCTFKYPESDNNFNYLNPDPSNSFAPHKIFNIGNSSPINLLRFIAILENSLGLKAEKIYKPLQQGDVLDTFASSNKLKDWINYKPSTSIENGVNKFAKWYLEKGHKY